jgi:hypothetical protein
MFFKKKPRGRSSEPSNGKTPPPLVTLTAEELQQLTLGERICRYKQFEHNLVVQGQRAAWMVLKRKYGLPDELFIDWKTGDIFTKQPIVDTPAGPVQIAGALTLASPKR